MSTVGRAAIAAIFSFLVLTATFTSSLAQQTDSGQQPTDTERLKAAEELVAVYSEERQSQMIQQLTAIVWPQLKLTLRAHGLDRQTVEGIHQDYADAFSSMVLDLTHEISAPVIAQHFTTQELRDLTVLESTPLARRYQAEVPGIIADSAKAALLRKDEIEKKLSASLQQILTKHGYCASHPRQCS